MSKNSIVLNIKGRDWTFTLMTDKAFDKIHNPNEGDGNTAMTSPTQYKVDFKKTEWTLTDIIHELGHVLLSMNSTKSVTFTPEQMEETMCDVYAENFFEIALWASRIAEKFFGRE